MSFKKGPPNTALLKEISRCASGPTGFQNMPQVGASESARLLHLEKDESGESPGGLYLNLCNWSFKGVNDIKAIYANGENVAFCLNQVYYTRLFVSWHPGLV